MTSLFADLREETTVLRHKFRKERVPLRPDIIKYTHDLENCELCRLLDALDVATDLLREEGYDRDPDYRQEWATVTGQAMDE